MIKTIGGDEVWLYPREPNSKMVKGCIVKRGMYPWSREEHRMVSSWHVETGISWAGHSDKNNPNNLDMKTVYSPDRWSVA